MTIIICFGFISCVISPRIGIASFGTKGEENKQTKSCLKKNGRITVVGRYVLPLRPSEYKYVVCVMGRYYIIIYMRFICIIPSSGCAAIARGFVFLSSVKKGYRNIWSRREFLALGG